jgi:hypothetical protein
MPHQEVHAKGGCSGCPNFLGVPPATGHPQPHSVLPHLAHPVGLLQVLGAEEMPKNDVLLGLPALSASDRQLWGPCLQLLNGPLPTGGRQ